MKITSDDVREFLKDCPAIVRSNIFEDFCPHCHEYLINERGIRLTCYCSYDE